jgi:hypothetical protein
VGLPAYVDMFFIHTESAEPADQDISPIGPRIDFINAGKVFGDLDRVIFQIAELVLNSLDDVMFGQRST